jgi:curved DNA-binding protein CbpA
VYYRSSLRGRIADTRASNLMSAPLAGKFQDHYEVLGVEVNAELETIQRVHSELARIYHPDNLNTGDQQMLDAVNLAYEVLSQPELRKEFDRVKGVGEDSSAPKFGGLEFFDFLGRGTGLRSALLCVLYDRRRSKPTTPGMSMRNIENMLVARIEDVTFVLWYLKQRNLVSSDDKSNLQITVEGMDFLEKNQPAPEMVMPFLRPSAVIVQQVSPRAPLPAATTSVNTTSTNEDDSRRSAVNRILARGTN